MAMRESGHYESVVVRVAQDATAREVAERMEKNAVGCVVVTDAERRVAGVITDRDLLARVVAVDRDGDKTQARDVMTADPVCGAPDEPLDRIVEKMQSKGVRRLPIVKDGAVVGIVSLDDVLVSLSEELEDVGRAVRDEVLGSRRSARSRQRLESLEAAVEEIGTQLASLGGKTRDWLLDALRRRGDDKGS